MNVRQLIEQLSKLPSEKEVFLSKDEEGNAFHPIYDIEQHWMDDDNEIVAEDDTCGHQTDEDCQEYDECEWKRQVDLKNVVVLWP